MNDIIVNERIKITKIERHDYIREGFIFAKLIYKGRKFTLKYDCAQKGQLCCAAIDYIDLPCNEGSGVWKIIKEALDKIDIT